MGNLASSTKILFGDKCNNACRLCNSPHMTGIDIHNKNYEESLRKLYSNGIRSITITGYEPTLNQDFWKLMKIAKKIGFENISLETNGRIFYNKKNVELIKEAGLNKATISIKGLEEVNNEYTRTKSFHQTMNGIINLYEAGIKTEANILVLKKNIAELEELVEAINQFTDKINLVFPELHKNIHNKEYMPKYSEALEIIRRIIESKNIKEKISIKNTPLCIHGELYDIKSLFYLDEPELRHIIMEDIRKGINEHNIGNVKYTTLEKCKLCKYNFVCPGIMKEYYKIYGDQEIRPSEGKKIVPVTDKKDKSLERLELNVGLLCNNDCRFCISGDKRQPLDSVDNIKKEIKKNACKDIDLLNILGGEVTLIRELPEIIQEAKDNGFKNIHIITNGRRLCDEKYTRDLLESGLNRISVTLHGHTSELQDYIVQRKGAFEQTIKGLENLRNLKKEGYKFQLTIGTCVHKMNYRYLRDMVNIANEYNANEFLLININPIENCEKYPEDTIIEYDKIKPHLDKTKEYANKIEMPVSFSEFPHCLIYDITDIQEEDFEQIDNVSFADEKGRYNFDYVEQRTSNKVKHDRCKECIFNRRCEGIWKMYVKHFGEGDFKPVSFEDLKQNKTKYY